MNVSARQAALNRWTTTDKRWNKKVVCSIHISVYLFVWFFPHLYIYPFIRSFIRSFVYLFIHLSHLISRKKFPCF